MEENNQNEFQSPIVTNANNANNHNNMFYTKEPVPNATAVLVLGIISIAMCWCYGIIGIILGIVALALSSKASKLYRENPTKYSESSYKNIQAGKVCAIIGTAVSSLWLIVYVIYFLIIGAAIGGIFKSMPWDSVSV